MNKEDSFKKNSYYVIYGWMLKDLDLKGADLITFSVIYGFSRDGKGQYVGGIEYIQQAGNYSEKTIIESIDRLCNLGLVEYRGRLNGNNTNSIYTAWTKKVKNILKECPVEITGQPEQSCPVESTGQSVIECPVEITGPYNINNKDIYKEKNNKLSKDSSYTNSEEIDVDKQINQNEKIFDPLDFEEDDLLEENKQDTKIVLGGKRKLISSEQDKQDLQEKIIQTKQIKYEKQNLNKKGLELSKKKKYLQAVEKDIVNCLGITDKDKLQQILDWYDVIWDKGVKSTKHKTYIKVSEKLVEYYKKYSWEELYKILDTCIIQQWRNLEYAVPKQKNTEYNTNKARYFDRKDEQTVEERIKKQEEMEQKVLDRARNYKGVRI